MFAGASPAKADLASDHPQVGSAGCVVQHSLWVTVCRQSGWLVELTAGPSAVKVVFPPPAGEMRHNITTGIIVLENKY